MKPTLVDFPKYVVCHRAVRQGDTRLIVGKTYKVLAVHGDLIHVIVGLGTVAAVHFSRFLPTGIGPLPD